jgi:hypothetical protein
VRRRWLAPLPALGVALVLWAGTQRNFDFGASLEGPGSWHYLGPHLLTDKPVESLLALHVQPPGLNAIRGLDLIVTPGSHLLLTLVYLVLMLATVWLVVDALVELGLRPLWAGAVGVVFALLPATVLFAFSANSTIPTMTGCALAIWGVARLRRRPALGAVASAAGVVVLLVFRSSFVWLFALVWLAALAWLLWRSRAMTGRWSRAGVTGVVGAAVIVIALQAHYATSFGLVTLSSWAGENLFKALRQSNHLHVTPGAVAAASELGPCHASLVANIAEGGDVAWQPAAFYALPGCADLKPTELTGIEALDSPSADGLDDGAGQGNFNWAGRLRASAVFTDVMRVVVREDPKQLVYMALAGGPTGSRDSGLAIYLAPPEDSVFMAGRRPAYPNKTFGGVMGLYFAPVALFLTAAGVALALSRRDRSRLRPQPVVWFGVGMIGYHVAVSTLVEYGENNRFQAEISPVLVVVAALVVWAVVPARSTQTAPRPWSTARTVRASSTTSPESDQVST